MPYSAAAKKMMRDKYKKESPFKVAKEIYIEKPIKGLKKIGNFLKENNKNVKASMEYGARP